MLIHKYAPTTVQACVQTSCAMHACVHVRLFSSQSSVWMNAKSGNFIVSYTNSGKDRYVIHLFVGRNYSINSRLLASCLHLIHG